MRIKLEVPISVYVSPVPQFDFDEMYSYVVDTTLQDYVEYFFKQEYRKEYNPLAWYLEDNAREFVKDIENKWMHNELDEMSLSNDVSFRKFLKKKYKHDIEREYLSEHTFEELKDEMINFIEKNFEVDCEVLINE